jgi:hypothetical protein
MASRTLTVLITRFIILVTWSSSVLVVASHHGRDH